MSYSGLLVTWWFQAEEGSDPAELLLLPPPSFCRSSAPELCNGEKSYVQPWEAPKGYLQLLGMNPRPEHCQSLLSIRNITHHGFHPLVETAVTTKMIQVPLSHPYYCQGNPKVLLVLSVPGAKPFCSHQWGAWPTCHVVNGWPAECLCIRTGLAVKIWDCGSRKKKSRFFSPDRFTPPLLLCIELEYSFILAKRPNDNFRLIFRMYLYRELRWFCGQVFEKKKDKARNLISVDRMPEKLTALHIQCGTSSFHSTFSAKTTKLRTSVYLTLLPLLFIYFPPSFSHLMYRLRLWAGYIVLHIPSAEAYLSKADWSGWWNTVGGG